MKIKAIKLYQHVSFDRKMIGHVNAEQPNLSGLIGPVSLTFIEGMGVLIENANDAVIVSFNNLSAIQLDKSSLKPAEKSEPKKK
jgi:hypothetical protein